MTAAAHPRAPLRYASAARTDAGPRRALNEDRVLDKPDAGVWAVADGMGGHQGGALAAGRVVAALAAIEHGRSGFARLSAVRKATEAVNAGLFQDHRAGMTGSTLVALLVHDDHFACVWAGDSRAYLLRDGLLTRLTRDHSVVQELVDRGVLAEAERAGHPKAHVITRAIGAAAELALDETFAPVAAGDVFLLCSDGLTGCVSDAEIAQGLAQDSAEAAADQLLALALSRAPSDNVSLVVVQAG